jgi:hypothetical protein
MEKTMTRRIDPVALIEYEIELERINGKTDHTSASLPSLTKGQRSRVRVDPGKHRDGVKLQAECVPSAGSALTVAG